MDSFSFLVTRKCNACCLGCPVEKNSKKMTPEVFKKAAGVLFPFISKYSVVKFFGGEPLFEFPLICDAYSYLKKKGFSGTFEVGTNGLLLDKQKALWFRTHTDIQVNFNAGFAPTEYALSIKNAIWNLCVYPKHIDAALSTLFSLANVLSGTSHRINILPASYCVWTPADLAKFSFVLPRMLDYILKKGLSVENINRKGRIPLFNDGLAVDTDGTIYTSNICLAIIPKHIKQNLIFNPKNEPYKITVNDLIEIFGFDNTVSAYTAGRILEKYVS